MMRKAKKMFIGGFMVFFLILSVFVTGAWSGPPVTVDQVLKARQFVDDPRNYCSTLDWRKILPKEELSKFLFDVEKMKARWAELVGFRSPDIVDKIAPEIKPGVYNYKDKEKYPGLKELMIPEIYEQFRPGGRPFAGNFQQIEIVPTQQLYAPLPYAEMSLKNAGTAKQDDRGYFIADTYDGGLAFPKPSGKFKAMQVLYNNFYNPHALDSCYMWDQTRGFTKELREDWSALSYGGQLKVHGRATPPFGWYDERAKRQGELKVMGIIMVAPRDMFGTIATQYQYLDPQKLNRFIVYIPGLRRVRQMTATDTQDVQSGNPDSTNDDFGGFCQKMSPTVYPLEYKIIAEREYLFLSPQSGCSNYYISSSSKGLERINSKWERRPVYVVELTELDKSYVYSKRILYVDKETFLILYTKNYDQKGRLYRTMEAGMGFIPEAGSGVGATSITFYLDRIDLHSTVDSIYSIPDSRMGREMTSVDSLQSRSK
jgi:hypothetical protein